MKKYTKIKKEGPKSDLNKDIISSNKKNGIIQHHHANTERKANQTPKNQYKSIHISP